MAFKHGDQTLITLDAGGATQLQSATGKDIVIYPADNVWIKEGTKLVFEGTVPDNFEAKLQATSVTADRDIILPDESGTLATQAYVTLSSYRRSIVKSLMHLQKALNQFISLMQEHWPQLPARKSCLKMYIQT